MKSGAPTTAVTAPTASSLGATMVKSIGEDDGGGSADGGRGQQSAMVRAKDKAHQVGHDQANVADGAAHGDGQTGQERGSNVDDQADSRNVHAKMHGLFFAGKKQIQIGSGCINRAGSGKEPDSEKPINTFLKRGGEIAHQPEKCLLVS